MSSSKRNLSLHEEWIWGKQKKENTGFTGFDGVDLMNQKNNLGICYQQWGKREAFPRGTLSDAPLMREPRWFKFGNNRN
jgi:hypothetical protein